MALHNEKFHEIRAFIVILKPPSFATYDRITATSLFKSKKKRKISVDPIATLCCGQLCIRLYETLCYFRVLYTIFYLNTFCLKLIIIQ